VVGGAHAALASAKLARLFRVRDERSLEGLSQHHHTFLSHHDRCYWDVVMVANE